METSGTDNTYLYMAIVLGEGEINGITEIRIDDKTVTFASSLADNTAVEVNSSDGNFYKDSENEEYLDYLYQITNGSSFLTKKFIEFNFYEINDHFKALLNNKNKIKSNTASHYIDYLQKFKNIEQVIPVFFNYLQLLISDEIKKLCYKNENKLVIRLLNVYTVIESINKNNMKLNLDFENIVISLFHKLKYE